MIESYYNALDVSAR